MILKGITPPLNGFDFKPVLEVARRLESAVQCGVSRRRFLISIVSLPVLSYSASAPAAEKFSLANTVYERVGREANIDPVLLYALTCVESAVAAGEAKEGLMQPYPWTLRYAGEPFYGKTKEEAEAKLKSIMTRHRRPNVDIGIAQINSIWHGHRVKHLTDLLDPYTNLKIAADILNECLALYPKDAFRAIGAYHSGNKKKAERYARFVVRLYTTLKEKEG